MLAPGLYLDMMQLITPDGKEEDTSGDTEDWD